MGGDMTYEHVSGNTYRITFTFFRDCSGIPAPGSVACAWFSTNCNYSNSTNLVPQGGCTEVSPLCPSYLPQSTCNGGSQPGVQKCVYAANITLPQNCTDWIVGVAEAARNASINTINNPGNTNLYVYARIDNTNSYNNNSAVFSTIPTAYLCVGQPATYNLGAVDPDGDSLAFQLISPLQAWNSPVSFISPYNATYPIATTPANSFGFNPLTSQMTFVPSTVQRGVLAVLVKEYRNGVYIASTERDIQIVVLNCSNTPPELPAGGYTNLQGGQFIDSTSAAVCVGQTISFQLIVEDDNAGNTLTMTSNIGSSIPGGIFIISGINPVTGSFIWTPAVGDTGMHVFTVTVNDGACPVSSIQTWSFSIYVSAGTYATPDYQYFCGIPIQLNAYGGTVFTWAPAAGLSCAVCPDPVATPTVTTTYTVTSDLIPGNPDCTNWDTVTIYIVPPFTFDAGPDVTICQNALTQFFPTYQSNYAPYDFLWAPSNTLNCPTCENPIANPTVTTTYTLTMTANTGCELTDVITVTILGVAPIVNAIASPTTVCSGDQVSLVATASVQSTYTWSASNTTAVIADPNAQNTTAVVYETTTFFVNGDNGGCSGQDYATVVVDTSNQITVSPATISVCAGTPVQFNTTVSGPVPDTDLTCGANGTPVTGAPFQATSGSGTTYMGQTNYPNIFGNYYQGSRHQILYRLADINNAGISDDAILSSIAFNIQGVNGSSIYNNFQIKMGCTALTTLTSWQTSNMQTVMTPQTVNITTGWNTFNLTSPFDWNGTSNIIVEICFNNATSSLNSPVYYTSAGYNSVVYYMQNSQSVCGTTNIIGTSYSRPNIRFTASYPLPAFSYVWTPSTDLSCADCPNPVATVTQTTTYTVQALGGFCDLEQIVTITIDPCVGLTTTVTDVTCFGADDGTILITPTSGLPPFTYSLDGVNYQSSNFFTNLPPGSYTAYAMDATGAISSSVFVINEPTQLLLTISSTNVTCNGGNDGGATANVSGGTMPYTYLWNNTDITQTTNGLTSGNYSVVVTDDNGCTASANVTIASGITISLTTSTTPASCGGSDGSATVTASGGNSPYTYLWSDGQITQTATGLPPGFIGIIVTDNAGCSVSALANVSQASNNIVITPSVTDVSCNGGNDGSITASVTGASGPVTFLWNNGFTTSTINNLIAGTYSVTVTDSLSCTQSLSITVSEPTAVNIVLSPINISCNGAGDGSITATPSGGTSGYTYLWSNGFATQTISNLIPGSYVVVVTDANGCTATTSATISEPTVLTLIVTGIDATCNGAATGSAIATPGGGSGTYTYVWSNSQVTQTAINLIAGTFTVIVTDASGCTITGSITINEPAAMQLTITTIDASCFGSSDGSATVNAVGGTAPYSYLWSNGQINQTATNLSANSYSVIVTDASGCSSTISGTINQPSQIQLSFTTVDVSCSGNSDGSATVNASGGAGGYTYSWSNGPATQTNPNLLVGTYTVTVTDANGCTQSGSTIIASPGSLNVLLQITDVSCNGYTDGSITVVVSGGSGSFSYLWSNGAITQAINNLVAGSYTVTVSDLNGCTIIQTGIVNEPMAVSLQLLTDSVGCFGESNGAAIALAAGGTLPYSFSLTGNNYQADPNFTGLPAGNYTLSIMDGNGCISTSYFSIYQPGPLAVDLDIDISLNITDQIQLNSFVSAQNGVIYSWTPPTGLSCADCPDPIASPYQTTTYVLTVYDQTNGCYVSDSVDIIVNNDLINYVPNAFTPNGDGINDVIYVSGQAVKTIDFSIYDRWGELLFHSEDLSQGWDGRYNGQLLNPGVFIYTLRITFLDDKLYFRKGDITLIR